jgi:hypothetical protein
MHGNGKLGSNPISLKFEEKINQKEARQARLIPYKRIQA